MSKLDTLYLNFEKYANYKPIKGSQVYQLNLYPDRTGALELLSFRGTDDNPFKAERETIVSWKSIPEGAKKIGELLDAAIKGTESTGSTDSADMAAVSSTKEPLQS